MRPTYIVGLGDPTDRYTYWPVRLARGGEVLAPGTPGDPMQHVDVRDLGAFMIKAVERPHPECSVDRYTVIQLACHE